MFPITCEKLLQKESSSSEREKESSRKTAELVEMQYNMHFHRKFNSNNYYTISALSKPVLLFRCVHSGTLLSEGPLCDFAVHADLLETLPSVILPAAWPRTWR
jgi:hypothetical protein